MQPKCVSMKQIFFKQKQLFFFIIAGGLSAMMEVSSFKGLSLILPSIISSETNFYGIHFPLSNVFSTSLGIITNYFFSIWFVFQRGKHSKRREFAYFMLVSLLSTLLSLVFFQIFFTFVFKNHLKLIIFTFSAEVLSKISAIILTSILNYFVKKKMIFNG